jgi:hypothetical protein
MMIKSEFGRSTSELNDVDASSPEIINDLLNVSIPPVHPYRPTANGPTSRR